VGRGNLFVLSGPSGVGKGSVVELLREHHPELFFSTSVTTREPRGDERDGVQYSFATDAQFQELLANKALLEHAEVFGRFYGTPIAPIEDARAIGKDAVLEIDVQGAMQVRERVPDAVLIFLVPPSMEELERRLRERGTEDPAALEARLAGAQREMDQRDRFDHVVENADLEQATAQVAAIIGQHRAS
jgi:guanylate kinase